MNSETYNAIRFIHSLAIGQEVTLTADGRDNPMFVTRSAYQSDGFGAPESIQVMVSYGPGRYSRSVSAAAIVAGYVGLRAGHDEVTA